MKTHMMPLDYFLTRPDGKCFMREVSRQAHSISILVNPPEVLSFLFFTLSISLSIQGFLSRFLPLPDLP